MWRGKRARRKNARVRVQGAQQQDAMILRLPSELIQHIADALDLSSRICFRQAYRVFHTSTAPPSASPGNRYKVDMTCLFMHASAEQFKFYVTDYNVTVDDRRWMIAQAILQQDATKLAVLHPRMCLSEFELQNHARRIRTCKEFDNKYRQPLLNALYTKATHCIGDGKWER